MSHELKLAWSRRMGEEDQNGDDIGEIDVQRDDHWYADDQPLLRRAHQADIWRLRQCKFAAAGHRSPLAQWD